jgi:hypothetical protein
MRLSGDFETASLGNLTRMGAYKYARQFSTRILCFAFALDDETPEVLVSRLPDTTPAALACN